MVVPHEPSTVTDTGLIAVSVVIPLLRAREADLDGVAAWVDQTVEHGRIEIVVVGPGASTRDGELRRLLGPGDQFLIAPDLAEPGLWDIGAKAARGEALVLTECHSIPQPGCLSAALDALGGGLDVACFESRAPELTAAAWLEDAIYQRMFERYVDGGDPRAVSLRGVALRRATYLEAGGLRVTDHECFAERVFAARLTNIGARIGRAPGALVEHVPNTCFRRVRQDSLDFLRDEVGARTDGPECGIDPERHLEPVPEWETRTRFDPGLNRAALPGLARLAIGRGSASSAARHALPGAIAFGAAGPRFASWGATVRSRLATSAFALAWRRGRRPDPSPVWSALARASMLRILSERARAGMRAAPLQLTLVGAPVDADTLGGHVVGLYSVERYDGTPFRWTAPTAVIDIEPPLDAAYVTVRHLGIRAVEPEELGAAWGSRRVPPESIEIGESTIRVPALAGAHGPLVLAVGRFESSGDPRRLGLPLVALALS